MYVEGLFNYRPILGKLNQNQIKSIEAIKGWDWTVERVKAWQDKFNEVKNNLPSNKLNKSQKQWIRQQKYFYRNNKLPKERILLIENIEGWKWN